MKKRIISLILLSTLFFVLPMCSKNGGYRGVKPVELSIHLVFNGIVFDENWDVFQLAAKKTKTILKGSVLKNSANSAYAFNWMLVSGDFPDIIAYVIPELEKIGYEGGMLNLVPLINEYAPNIKKFMEEQPQLAKDMYTSSGQIYAIPTYYDSEKLYTTTGIFIRTDWLAKFNLPVPSTTDELERVLTTIVYSDANGNGKQDEIGLFARGPNGSYSAVKNTSGILGARQYNTFYVHNGKINYSPLDPDFKPAITLMADWYKKGLVDPDLFSRGSSAREQILPTNRGTVTQDWFVSTAAFNQSIQNIPDFAFLPIPPLKKKDGTILSKNPERANTNGFGWGISVKAKNPVAAIKFMDWWFSEEGRRAWNWGIEGKHYIVIDEKLQFTDYVLKNPDNMTPLNTLYKEGAQIAGVGVMQDANYEFAIASDIAKKGWTMYSAEGAVYKEIPLLKFTREEQEELSKIDTAVNQTTAEYIQRWILGASNIQSEWDTYVTSIRELGIERAIQIRQKAYDRYISGF